MRFLAGLGDFLLQLREDFGITDVKARFFVVLLKVEARLATAVQVWPLTRAGGPRQNGLPNVRMRHGMLCEARCVWEKSVRPINAALYFIGVVIFKKQLPLGSTEPSGGWIGSGAQSLSLSQKMDSRPPRLGG